MDVEDNVDVSLVLGKSILAPIKQQSIPRLELSGAVVACRLYRTIAEELEIPFTQTYFWTDSTIVLGYIRNESRRFKTFVGNRLSEIHERTTPDQWHHVGSTSNPADVASRGVTACETETLQFWLKGPNFLFQDPTQWLQEASNKVPDIAENDAEVKKEVAVYTTTVGCIERLIDYFSDWTKLRRAVAWMMRFKTYCRQQYLKHPISCAKGELSLKEMREATEVILKHVQCCSFAEELEHLRKGRPIKIDSCIATLNPTLDDGIIRAKGRLHFKEWNAAPIILPSKHHVTDLIIRFYHEIEGHMGKQQVLSETRKKFWILRGLSAVKRVVGNCLPCKRRHGALCKQQMAPLLKEQTTPDKFSIYVCRHRLFWSASGEITPFTCEEIWLLIFMPNK